MKRISDVAGVIALSAPFILGHPLLGQAQEAMPTAQAVPKHNLPAQTLHALPLTSPNPQFATDANLIVRDTITLASDAEGWGLFNTEAIANPIASRTTPLPITTANATTKVSQTARDLMPSDHPASVLTAQAEPSPATETPAEPSSAPEKPASPTAPEANTQELAKAAQNPIANLISLPFQNNFNFGVGPFDQTQYVLNIQPVIPVSLGSDWLVVNRIITPIVNQPTIDINPPSAAGSSPSLDPGYTFGLGDINPQFYFVPKNTGEITWGIGPQFSFPTATTDVTGSGKWSVGPVGVIVYTHRRWVIGALVNQIWSFAGDSDREAVSQFLLQPFINYNLPKGWYLTTGPQITANWMAEPGEQWTLPLGGGIGRLFKVEKQPINASLQAYGNVVKPENGPDWLLRFQVQFLFPTHR